MASRTGSFDKVIHSYVERYKMHRWELAVCDDQLITDAGGLEQFLEKQERISVTHLTDLELFSQLHAVSDNVDELRLLGVYSEDYAPRHYVLRGMAAEQRDKRPVYRNVALQAFLAVYAMQKSLREILSEEFSHNFDEMVGQAEQKP